ncbi:hypothetical protein IAU60_003778 [Kwoniella sp. DSM 27419]
MSFDPFEARLQFLQLLRKLNASQLSIQKVVSFAIKYGSRCGEDMWECVMEQCGKGSLNTRINILYFLDTLLEVSLPLGLTDAPYPEYVNSHLKELVEKVVPDTREGVLNLRSAKQILESWRTRRIVDHDVVEGVIKALDGRPHGSSATSAALEKRSHDQAFSKTEILRRMEEDRERHKRLRERIWILPIPPLAPPRSSLPGATPGVSKSSPSTTSPFTPASPSGRPKPSASASASAGAPTPSKSGAGKMPPPPPPSAATPASGGLGLPPSPLEVEFEQAWEGTSDLDDEELDKMRA